MPLVDWQIRRLALERDPPLIDPFDGGSRNPGRPRRGLGSSGYDLTLGRNFKLPRSWHESVLDPSDIDPDLFEDHAGEACLIPAHGFVLAESVETFAIPDDLMVVVVGKSSWCRLGLIANVSPGESGWRGRWTLELANHAPLPVTVRAGDGIAQALFLQLDGRPEQSYPERGGLYQSQTGVTLPRVRREQGEGG